MCAECGADLRETNQRSQTAAVAMVHNIPELMVSMKVHKQTMKLLGKFCILHLQHIGSSIVR